MLRLTGIILLIIHFFLLFWSAGGFLEMLTPNVFWKPYTNPAFPDWLLVFHWGSVLFASVIFIYGYLTRWKITPQIMTYGYGLMAIVCAVETFGYMVYPGKYIAMAAEYVAYIIILFVLFKTAYFKNHFRY